jgi:hypothetical protein
MGKSHRRNTPQVDASTPQVDASTPQVDASTPQVDASTPQVDASTPQVDASTPQARVYTFRAYHSRGTMWVSFVSPGGGNVVAEAAHFAVLPVAGDTLTLAPTSDNVPGHTLAFAGVTKAGRYTYRLAGAKGVWTIYASQMPAGSVVDGIAASFLRVNRALVGAQAQAPATTTAAVIAAANMSHTVEQGVTVQPGDIADVQQALGVKAVS